MIYLSVRKKAATKKQPNAKPMPHKKPLIILFSLRSVIKRATELSTEALSTFYSKVVKCALSWILVKIAAVIVTLRVLTVSVSVGLCRISPYLTSVWVDTLGVSSAGVVCLLCHYWGTLAII